MLGTGFKEKAESGGVRLDELTKQLRPHITEEKGNSVKLKPSVVVEVAYEVFDVWFAGHSAQDGVAFC